MSISGAAPGGGTPAVPEPRSAVDEVLPPLRRPNLRGDLDTVLDFLPAFPGAVRGYERGRVDSYVAWAERELRAARRSADEMAARFGACSAELERTREELARSDAARGARELSDRMARVLELAGEEAAEITAAGAAEAEGLVTAAREYAAAMLRHAREADDAAAVAAAAAAQDRAAAADELAAVREQVQSTRAQLAAEVTRLAAGAAAERTRLDRQSAARRGEAEEKARRQRDQEAAAAAEGVAAARREVEELHRRRDSAAEELHRFTERIGEALQALAAGLPLRVPNVVEAQHVQRTGVGAPAAGRPR